MGFLLVLRTQIKVISIHIGNALLVQMDFMRIFSGW